MRTNEPESRRESRTGPRGRSSDREPTRQGNGPGQALRTAQQVVGNQAVQASAQDRGVGSSDDTSAVSQFATSDPGSCSTGSVPHSDIRRAPDTANGSVDPDGRLSGGRDRSRIDRRSDESTLATCSRCAAGAANRSQQSNLGTVDAQPIQPKLRIGAVDDQYEREAERVATAVLGTTTRDSPEGRRGSTPATEHVQRLCPRCRERYRQGKPLDCQDCEQKLQGSFAVQRSTARDAHHVRTAGEGPGGRAVGPGSPTTDLESSIRALRGGGRQLPDRTRSFFERRFGYDFGSVRIHEGSRANAVARSIDAEAFTVGTDVVFRDGAYRPGTQDGKRLIAHELTHVVQQNDLGPSSPADRAMRTPSTVGSPPIRRSTDGVRVQRRCADGDWVFQYDGCSVPSAAVTLTPIDDADNPYGAPDTRFARCEGENCDSDLPCDKHDECYQTCGPRTEPPANVDRTLGEVRSRYYQREENPEAWNELGWQYDWNWKAKCDREMYERMLDVCEQAGNPGDEGFSGFFTIDCTSYAEIYYWALRNFGDDAFEERQRQVCSCTE